MKIADFLKRFDLKESNHVNTVVFLRFFAAFCVLWTHLCFATPNFFLREGPFLKLSGELGGYGVEIFFIISGFIIPWSLYHTGYNIKKFGPYLLRRLARLEPPYLLAIVMILCLNYFYSLHHGSAYVINYKALLAHLGYLNAFLGLPWLSSVFWTLAIEFQYYVLIGVTYNLFVSYKPYLRYSAFFIFFFPLISTKLGPGISYPSYTMLMYSHLFLLGILTFLIKKRLISWQIYILSFSLILSLSIKDCVTIQEILRIIFWIASIFIILFLNFETKITNFLGKISYSLYLTHELFGGRVVNLMSSYSNNMLYKAMVLFLALVTCVLFAYMFYFLIEKPSIRLSKRIKY